MKRTKRVLVFLTVAVFVFAGTQLALAGREGKEETTTNPPIETNPNFQGLKIPGIMGILYEGPCPCGPFPGDVFCFDQAPCLPGVGPLVKMTFFMRLTAKQPKGETKLLSYGLVDAPNPIPYGPPAFDNEFCYSDYDRQQTAIEKFVKDNVIPNLAAEGIIYNPCACFDIQSATGKDDPVMQDENMFCKPVDPLCHWEPVYSLVDFVLVIEWPDKGSCVPGCVLPEPCPAP